MLDNASLVAHPRMIALYGEHMRATAQHGEWMREREAALAATLREEHHFAETGHHAIGGENGTCAACGGQVHPAPG